MPAIGSDTDTIAAIATPRGLGGIGVIRISGDRALAVVRTLFRPVRGDTYDPKRSHSLTHGHIRVPSTGEVVDEVLVAYFRPPRTYTGEQLLEVSTHGGDVVLRTVLSLLCEHGARMANPGEFSLRAFLNGRIDLAQAEAVADVIHAKTQMSLRAAAGQLTGSLSREVGAVRRDLIGVLAEVEAAIDFPEDDLDLVPNVELAARARDASERLRKLLGEAHRGRYVRDGLRVAILGKPNVGKSSLLNALLREDRAIVTEFPGTTRDAIEEIVDVDGVPIRLTDTAGMRDSSDPVEREGVARSRRHAEAADLLLIVLDVSRPLDADDHALLERSVGRPRMLLLNKTDLPSRWDETALPRNVRESAAALPLSVKTGDGIEDLTHALAAEALGGNALDAEPPLVTNVRHEAALRDADVALGHALASLDGAWSPEFVAVDLRGALDALGLIVGETASDEILDAIFSQFCIGK